jgi:hypothetical protein
VIPICREKGCQATRPCSGACVLQGDFEEDIEPAPPTTTSKQVLRPKKGKLNFEPTKTHLGTGKKVTRKTLPQWRGKPSGPEPWEQGRCGVLSSTTVTDLKLVTCVACLRAAGKHVTK